MYENYSVEANADDYQLVTTPLGLPTPCTGEADTRWLFSGPRREEYGGFEFHMVASIGNIDYVVLLCKDLGPMTTFYHDTLGFPIERDWEDWIEMRVGAVLLTLRPRGRPYDGPQSSGAGVQLAFRVLADEVNEWHKKLLEKHVEILDPPRDQDYGHRTLFFKDPEGNILEIYAEI